MYSRLNPQTTEVQFNGTVGAIAISAGLPVLLVLFGLILDPEAQFSSGLDISLNTEGLWKYAVNGAVWRFYLAYFFGFVALDLIVPGTVKQGVKLRDNTALTYKINGLNFITILVGLGLARFYYLGDLPELTFIYTHQLEFVVVCCLFSFVLAFFVYFCSFIPLRAANGVGTNERILAEPGNTGNAIYDWFIGRELNPRIGLWDIKLFCELKPGMTMWLLINVSCMYHQYREHGAVADSMVLINFLQGFYIFDGILNEEGVLTMMDVVTDGFGFMLAFGDLALVPWSYSLQARYLSMNFIDLGYPRCLAIVALAGLGYYIFHSANQQKSDFKNGKLDHLEYIRVNERSRLLVDGWWGLSQHINYMGDWFIGLSWCLTTGFNTPITYFYAVYFATLLIHRQVRDDEKCAAKYKASWAEYKRRVPYKIVPYVY